MRKIITDIVFILFICFSQIYAELPYESNHTKSFVATSRVREAYVSNKFDHIFNVNYIYNNKIIVGMSYRNNFHNPHVTLDPVTSASIGGDPSLLELSKSHRHNYLNVYTLIKPDKLFRLKTPISLSLFIGLQDLKEERNIIGNLFIYKNISFNSNHSIQPLVGIGYRNININSSGGYRNFDAGLIYYYKLSNSFQITVAPMMNRYFGENNYSIQIGLMFGNN